MATITWDGGQSISASVSGTSVTITLNGRATLDLGSGIKVEAGYRLYEGSTDLGALSNKTITITNQSYGSHTYTVKGYYYNAGHPVYSSSGDPSRTVTISEPTPTVTWNGTPTITATYNGNGSVTFSLNGSATVSPYGVEAAYEVLIGSSNVGYMTSKALTVERPPGTQTYTCRAYFSISGRDYYSTSGNPTVAVTVPAPTLTWSSGANMSYTIDGQDVVFDINGDITVGGGYTARQVYYGLYYGQTYQGGGITDKRIRVSGGAAWTEYLWALYAYVYSGGSPTYSTPLTVMVSLSDYVAYYNGTSWVQCVPWYYNGSAWVECQPYYYNGTSWVEISYKP